MSRRQYAQLLAGGAATGLAGCLGVLEAEAGLGDDDVDAYEPPDTITVAADNTPEQSNFNEWTDDRRTDGIEYLTEVAAPRNAATAELVTSGDAFDADWIEDGRQISVPAMLEDYELEPPDQIVEHYDDRLTYWDGTPLDARAMYLHDKLYEYEGSDGANALNDEPFHGEVVDDWTYRRTVDPGSEPVLESNVFRLERVPLHPDFTEPYHERLEDASNESAAAEIVEELRQETLSIADLVQNQWGSGLYRVESLEDVDEDGLIAHRDDSHPNEHAAIDRLEVLWASEDQQTLAAQRGRLDVGGGALADSGDMSRTELPAHVQEIDQFSSPSGDKLLFNWNNQHLEELWVRRAIVALVDWTAVRRQGWGTGSEPIAHDTGLHTTVSERYFEDDFLEDLHQYPREYDLETALDWLRNAGYTGSRSEGWTSPDGEPLELTISIIETQAGHVRAGRTIQANLASVGIDSELQLLPQEPEFSNATGMENPTFDLAILWDDFPHPWEYYNYQGGWWASTLVGGAPDGWWNLPETDYGEVDNYGMPLEPEIPLQPGSISAPNQAGRSPSLSGGERIKLPELVYGLQRPDTDAETFDEYARTCARFYNFYLPQFLFHSTTAGLWGNRRDFEFPERGNPINKIAKGVHGGQDYQVMGGLPQPSQDGSYPELGE